MEVAQILHMNTGDGETSYYQNSTSPQWVLLRARQILKYGITQVCKKSKAEECLKIADMGCSSGPNTLLPLWEMIETIDSTCAVSNKKPPVLQAFLNDLPGTDFNTIFRKLVPEFHVKLMEKHKDRKPETCLIGAMPGSFYTKLFPKNSLHFVHSSCAVHWLSQVPEGLVTENGVLLNKVNICFTKTSPPIVHNLCSNQFQNDFTTFLKLRSEEVISGGGMGKITQYMLDSFNIPIYAPTLEEVKEIVANEGSFSLEGLEEFDMRFDIPFEEGKNATLNGKGKYLANGARAVAEAMIASHFGDAIIDDVFHRLSSGLEAYVLEDTHFTHFLVISLTKK